MKQQMPDSIFTPGNEIERKARRDMLVGWACCVGNFAFGYIYAATGDVTWTVISVVCCAFCAGSALLSDRKRRLAREARMRAAPPPVPPGN